MAWCAVPHDDQPCSDPLSGALLAHLIRKGVLDESDAIEIADKLEEMDEPEAAHQARCAWLRANEPSQSDWQAEQRRNRFRVIEADGGNEG